MPAYKTAKLSGPRLDMAVAMAEGYRFGKPIRNKGSAFMLFPLAIPRGLTLASAGWNIAEQEWGVNVRRYSKEDRYAGPIMDREKISTTYDADEQLWRAQTTEKESIVAVLTTLGTTRVEAAMRLHALNYHGPQLELPI